jgi:phosphoribosylamine--glycine ligase
MNILILGSGGREHAFAWKIKQSTLCNQLFIAPGNAGTMQCGTNLNISATDFDAIKNAVIENNISMVLVGPEDPLVKGIYDFFAADESLKNVQVIGPSKKSAQLEGSKAFAKTFMQKNNIPTAAYKEFNKDNYADGVEYIKQHSLPIVLKADGLAAGKGVLICQNHEDALAEFELMIQQSKFGAASEKVVIESYLNGIEISVFVLTDGKDYLILPEAKDYKRIGEGDTGLNTGGMGAVSPIPFFDAALKEKITTQIIEPTIKGFKDDNMIYHGFIFLGLMIDNGNPYMIEYNCRMGDPETEVVIPRIKSDFVAVLKAIGDGKLGEISLDIEERAAATTIMVSGGYPGNYETGKKIYGLTEANHENGIIFHSGTKMNQEEIVTNGGRVLAITSYGNNIQKATKNAQQQLNKISFEGAYFRKDIGYEFE